MSDNKKANGNLNLVDDEQLLTMEELRTIKLIVRWWSAGKLSALFVTGIVSLGFGIMPVINFLREHFK